MSSLVPTWFSASGTYAFLWVQHGCLVSQVFVLLRWQRTGKTSSETVRLGIINALVDPHNDHCTLYLHTRTAVDFVSQLYPKSKRCDQHFRVEDCSKAVTIRGIVPVRDEIRGVVRRSNIRRRVVPRLRCSPFVKSSHSGWKNRIAF